MVSGGTLARLTGRAGLREAAERWSVVWKARANWLPGYPARRVLTPVRPPSGGRAPTASGGAGQRP